MMGFCPYIKGSLKESECHHDGYCSECPHNTKDDTISRQAAINAFDGTKFDETYCTEYAIGYNDGIDFAVSKLFVLPSAQPVDKDINVPINDTISRQAAVELATQYCPDDDGSCSKADRDIRELLDDLENLPPVQPEPQWIPCSERLPEEAGWYLCTYKDRRVNTKYWSKNKGWTDNIRLHMFELYDIRSRLTKEEVKLADESIYWDDWVVAWSRLPEPYKENKE